MLPVKGIIVIVKKAGTACDKSVKSIFKTPSNIITPTIIKAGAVAKDGMAKKIGDKKSAAKKQIAVVIAVSPVLPPAITPAELSTKVVTVDVPRQAHVVVAIASAKKACLIRGNSPFSLR